MINVAEADGIIVKSGSWYAYNDEKLGQGIANAAKTLKENPELMKEIVNKIKEKHNLLKDADEQPKNEQKPAETEDEKKQKKSAGGK